VAVGLNPVIANQLLDSLFSAAAFTPPAGCFIQLHTGDPGVAGTANVSSFATRTAVAWSSAAGGSKSISAPVVITASWAGTSPETIGYVSYWSAVTGGTFVTSDQLLAPVTVVTGSPLNLPSLTAPLIPLAA
jgi:hypothetical protein